MTSPERLISDCIQRMSGSYNRTDIFIVTGSVVSVDKSTRTCNVEVITGDSEILIEGVRLQTSIADGLLPVPVVGSDVTILYGSKKDSIVLQYSDIEVFEFYGGQLGGLVKVIDLVARLNLIENKVNSIISTYNSHSHPSNGAPPSVTISGTLTPTERENIENLNIKQ